MTMAEAFTKDSWAKANLIPLWLSKTAHKPMTGPAPPTVWRWSVLRPILEEALAETSPEVVERRVRRLAEVNSRAPEFEATLGNITAAIQALAPGESARPHRHSMGALRFIIEGSGAITVVDGKQCPMRGGDMVLTPAWCWHEHHHEGDRPSVWLDILDVPLHHYLRTLEFQPGPVRDAKPTFDERMFGRPGIVPQIAAGANHSPKFSYPYADVVAALEATPTDQTGLRAVRYVNPLTGGPAIPLLETRVVQVDEATHSLGLRSTASRLLLVVEGEGESRIEEDTIAWRVNDIIAVPPGNRIAHRATRGPARLFEVSDRDLLARLQLLSEDIQ